MASRRNARGEVGLGSDHPGGTLGAARGSSARGRGRRRLPGRCASSEWVTSLDVTGRGLETGGAFVQRAVDADVSEFPALEAGFVVSGVIVSEGGVVVTASPPNFGAFQGGFFFFGQGGRRGGGGQVLGSGGGFFDEVLGVG